MDLPEGDDIARYNSVWIIQSFLLRTMDGTGQKPGANPMFTKAFQNANSSAFSVMPEQLMTCSPINNMHSLVIPLRILITRLGLTVKFWGGTELSV